MEYLIVRFAESRAVLINGAVNGKTNSLLQAPSGAHTISLAPPANFLPKEGQRIELASTSPLDPKIVRFSVAPSHDGSDAPTHNV